ncbi:MAG: flagellar hook capping FlgD N-terminal domain-containing protein, partial [Candidatus Brocadiia bacterium]
DALTAAADQQDLYMKLLVAQLQNQNPMDPMSNAEMVSQMAQLASVDGIEKLNSSFSDVLRLYRLLTGSELIGRQVEYEQDGLPQSGTVESVNAEGQKVRLTVNGTDVPLDQIRKIL